MVVGSSKDTCRIHCSCAAHKVFACFHVLYPSYIIFVAFLYKVQPNYYIIKTQPTLFRIVLSFESFWQAFVPLYRFI